MTLDYFPFYYDAWMKSEMRAILPTPARAIFVEIFLRCCAEGSVPMNHDALIGISKCTPKEFSKAWPLFRRALVERDGRYVNLKALEVRQGVANKVKGGQARHKNGSAERQQNVSTTPAEPQQEASRTSAERQQSESRKQKAERKPTPPPSAREPREGEPDPAQAVRFAVERCSQFWPKIGNKRYAEAAWTREALESVEGIVAWSESIVATAQEHAEAHREALARDKKHFIPTLERWVSEGDYTSPPPGGSRSAEKERLRDFNEQQRIKTLREVAANTDPEDWAASARLNAIRELQALGLEP